MRYKVDRIMDMAQQISEQLEVREQEQEEI